MGKNTVTAHEWLEKCYKESAPSKSSVKYWFAEFRRGRKDTDDAERSGRPNEAVTAENVEKVEKLIHSNRKVKLQEIADALKLSKGTIFTIAHEHLGMKKLFSKWVPRFLKPEEKQQRMEASQSCLAMFTRNKAEFLRRYITMDETWIHHFTPETSRESAEWRAPGESAPKRPKTQQTAGKVMASVFWDTHGIIFIDYLEHGKTINSDYYIDLLVRLKAEIIKKRPHLAKKKVLFHQDNAPCHKSKKTMDKINELGFELLPHPPYSPDLAPSDYYLFSQLKKMLRGKRFRSDEEVIAESESYFEGLDASAYKTGIEKLEKRWNACISAKGNYFDE